jgi:hypothetical protein
MTTPPPAAHKIYNKSYTLSRLSPLHSFPTLTPALLAPHAKSLLTAIRGDVLRGVRIAADASSTAQLSRAGKLLSCDWTILASFDPSSSSSYGVAIEIVYENTSFTALLLPSDQEGVPRAKPGFTNLPLLMTRMPRSLRETLAGYLESTFDCVVAPLSLDDGLLRRALEQFVGDREGAVGGQGVALTFAPRKGRGLRAVTVTVESADVRRFWIRDRRGFLKALGRHLSQKVGMAIEGMDLVKVAAEGWVLGGGREGKWKALDLDEKEAVEKVLGLVIAETRKR